MKTLNGLKNGKNIPFNQERALVTAQPIGTTWWSVARAFAPTPLKTESLGHREK